MKALVEKNNNKKTELYFVVGIFVISIIFRYIIGDYPKLFHVYLDELIYYDEAESIATGRGLMVHNAQMGLVRVLYPLLISPAFLIADRIWQGRIILLINSIVMSSSVFPVYIIARRFLEKKARIAAVVMTVLLSDLTYTMTFMSEVLFLPLTLWLICLFTRGDDKEKANTKKAIVCGVLSALVYYTKEVGLMFIPAFLAVYLFDIIAAEKNKRKRVFIRSIKEFLIISSCFLILVFPHFLDLLNRVISLLMRAPVEQQNTLAGETVSGSSQSGVLSAAIMQMIYYLLAIGVVPVIVPAVLWKKMSIEKRRMCILLSSLMILMAVLVAYTITIHEDANFPFPRAHLRYVCYLWMPWFIIFCSLKYEYEGKDRIKWIIAMVFTVLVTLIFKGAYEGTTIDQTMLYYENKVFNDRIWIYRAGLCLGIAIFIILYNKNRVLAVRLFTVAFCLIMVANNIIAILIHRKDYKVDAKQWEQMVSMEQYITDNPESVFLVIDDSYDDSQRLMDTFLNKKNVFFANTNDVIYTENGRTITVGEVRPYSRLIPGGNYGIDLQNVDYLLMRNDKGLFAEGNMIKIEKQMGLEQYDIYQLNDRDVVPYIHY